MKRAFSRWQSSAAPDPATVPLKTRLSVAAGLLNDSSVNNNYKT
jgi:hypothetical protein